MGRVKKQHYVPVAYLRRFSPDGTRIFVWDKIQNRAFPSRVQDVAQERSFYDLSEKFHPAGAGTPSFDAQALEKAMWFVERPINTTIEDVIALRDGKKLNHEQRIQMGFLMGFQVMRTPIIRDLLLKSPEDVLQMHIDSLIEEGYGKLPPGASYKAHYEEGMETIVHGLAILNPVYMSRVVTNLYRHRWVLGINSSDVPLQTSDMPVALFNTGDTPADTPWDGDFAYPLDPQHILLLRQGKLTKEELPDDGVVRTLRRDEVAFYNGLQLQGCHRQLYCSREFSIPNLKPHSEKHV